MKRTYICLPGAWMGAWSWQFVLQRLRAAGHEARALPFRGVGERAAELSPELDNDVFLADTIATLEQGDLTDIVLVGHSFGSLIASLVTDRVPERIGHLVIIDGGIAQDGQSIFGRIPREIVAKRQKLVQVVNGTEVLPFAPVGSLIIDDPELAAWTHRQLTPHPVACYTKPIRLDHPAGNGRPMTYIACTRPRYPVSAGMHEKVQAMPHIRYRPIEAGHNCIISAPDLVARELLEISGMTEQLMILVAGPYRSGTNDDPVLIQKNVDAMEDMALAVFRRGHLPALGEWFALPLLKHAGSNKIGDAVFDEIFHPIARELIGKCDAVLRIGGPSAGADDMVANGQRLGKRIFHDLSEIPERRR